MQHSYVATVFSRIYLLMHLQNIRSKYCECIKSQTTKQPKWNKHQNNDGCRHKLTHGKQPPHHRRRGEAGEDVVRAGEVREMWQHDGLSAALPPHVHLTALGLRRRGVCGVTGGYLHDPGGGRRRGQNNGKQWRRPKWRTAGTRGRIHAGGEGTKGKEKGRGGKHQSDSHTSLTLPTLQIAGLLVQLLCIFCKLILAEMSAVTPREAYKRATPQIILKTGWLTGSSHQTNRKSPWDATIQTNNGTDWMQPSTSYSFHQHEHFNVMSINYTPYRQPPT